MGAHVIAHVTRSASSRGGQTGPTSVTILWCMPSSPASVSELGTRWSESPRWHSKSTGFLGLRTKTIALPPVRFLDWTIDGEPLRNRLGFDDGRPCRDITFLVEGSEGDRYAVESLKALLGESNSGFDPWVQYTDGRAGLLFCPQCGGLDCGAVSAEVVVGDDVVEWKTVAYQDGITGDVLLDSGPSFSLVFDRGMYEFFLRALLDRWDVKRIR